MTGALEAVAPRLRCPNCGAPLALGGRALRCPQGHAFDVARHGHVLLLPPRGTRASGDSAAMIAAREAFQAAGHYAPVARAVAEAAAGAPGGLAVELGAGTAYYLAAALGPRWGVALDVSRAALRRAARAHPRIAAVGADVWRELPLQDASAAVVLDVFSPRNGPEIARVLAPGGTLIVVTPTPAHLRELVEPLGLVRVDPRKPDRLRASLPAELRPAGRRELAFALRLARADAEAWIAMGPSAHHADPAGAAGRLPDPVRATASVVVETFRRA